MKRNPLLVPAALAAVASVAAIGYYSGRTAALATLQVRVDTPAAKAADATISTKGKGSIGTTATYTAANRRSATGRLLTSAVSNPSATAPLPPPNAPLKQTFAELKARADAGDAAAASRLFHDIQNCAEVQRINQMMPNFANRVLNGDPSSMSPGAAQRSDRMLGMIQKNLDFAQDNAALCADVGPDEMAALVPATLEAAQAGDPRAANCYVGANLNNWPGVLDNPNWISDYKANALPLATAAVQQGDWPMVGLMASAYAGGVRSNTMLTQVTGANPVQAYSYAKLMSLGQPAGNTSNRATNNLTNLASQLSSDQQQAADAWAQNAYQQYFASTPRQPGEVGNAMRSCQVGP
ncbi:MAG TPA: hypothetical protein VIE67_10745 [Rudaea sp.]|uniref:hypothetical protein n=1 Tax=Rudaea sp. TaxID=2136325 RepID=UPI002F93EC9C